MKIHAVNERSPLHLSRRSVVAASGLSLLPFLGGCTSFVGGDSDQTNISVFNNADTEWEVSVRIDGREGEELVNETLSIPADEDEFVDIPGDGQIRVHVTVETSADAAERSVVIGGNTGRLLSADISDGGTVEIETGEI